MRLSRALGSVLTLAAFSAAGAQTPSQFKLAADSLRKLVSSGVLPSVAFSVSNRSRVMYEDAFGYADMERGYKATPFTPYPVASVAKSLTAIGALRAVDRGLLRLDQPVNKILGSDSIAVAIGDASRVTLRSLLHMTAGIPHVVRFYWRDEPRDKSWAVGLGHFSAFPPGSKFHYSNQSLGIAGEVLSRISRKSFPRYMADEVFSPLGLSSSAVRVDGFSPGKTARAYNGRPARPTGFTRLSPEPGAGMYTSAHDLTTLARRVILDPDSDFLSARARRELTDFSQYPYYSTGWWKDPFRADDGLTLLADGAALGHSASMKVLPAEGLAVAVLVNGTVPDGFTIELCDLLLRAAGYTAPSNHEIPAAFVPRPVGQDTSWSGRWRGSISTGTASVPIEVYIDARGMEAAVGGNAMQRVEATISNGVLEANVSGEIPRSNVAGLPHTLSMNLMQSGSGLTGYVTAAANLGDRPFVMLPFSVSLRRYAGH